MSITVLTRTGLLRHKPTLEEVEEMDENQEGFCINCGEVASMCEPDARKYTCDCCGQPAVYGAAELALRGWVA